jgi:putative ABC transport system substrate-binding protein
MGRREFIALLGCGMATSPSGAMAQPALRKIGFVSWFTPRLAVHAEQFRRGLRDFGYIEGRDITVEAHFTSGDRDRTREVVRKYAQDRVDILVVEATPAIAVAKQEAGSLPIVMAMVSDPIAAGFAQSLPRPGGNLTGRTMFGPDLAGKRVDLLKEIRPGLRTVAFLGSSLDVNTARFTRETQAETNRIGMKLAVHLVEAPKAIDRGVFEAMRRDGAEAVIVQPIFGGHHEIIMALANEVGLPVVADWAMFAEVGAVLTYGIDTYANARRAAYFVDRIFKGARPAELPIEQPTEMKLVINVTAAKRFGWIIPPSVLARADEVIE